MSASDAARPFSVADISSAEAPEARLLRVIEGEIVPRMMLAHRRPIAEGGGIGMRRVTVEDIAELARFAVAHEAQTARSFIEALTVEGLGPEALLVDLIAPAARLLGEQWTRDRCSFAEVSIGLSVLQRISRELGLRLVGGDLRSDQPAPGAGRAVLAPVPGEQHTLGLQLVADFLRRDGWCAELLPGASVGELDLVVAAEHLDLVGLSVGNDRLLEKARALIARIRERSRNRGVLILVGGSCFQNPDNLALVGADATASDARGVIESIQRHLRRPAPGRER